MIIVSQDKLIITDDINIFINKNDIQNKENLYAIENEKFVLGRYKTKERAKEVLEAITATYQASKIFENVGSSWQNQMADKYLKTGTEPFKYQMPEE